MIQTAYRISKTMACTVGADHRLFWCFYVIVWSRCCRCEVWRLTVAALVVVVCAIVANDAKRRRLSRDSLLWSMCILFDWWIWWRKGSDSEGGRQYLKVGKCGCSEHLQQGLLRSSGTSEERWEGMLRQWKERYHLMMRDFIVTFAAANDLW